jgi:GH24 family phage-related lysozyme (muramidase)
MAQHGYIFGGDTGISYEQLQRRRKIADALAKQSTSRVPRNIGEGLNAIGQALMARSLNKKLSRQETAARQSATDAIAAMLGGRTPPGPAPAGGDPTLDLVRGFEGFKADPYFDVNADRIGYGSSTITNPDGTFRDVQQGDRVDRAGADRDLQRRIDTEFSPRAASAVGEDLFASLPGNQQAALNSITYNYGHLPDSVAGAVKSGNPQAVADAINALGAHNNGINQNRRTQEADFYLSGGGQGAAGSPGQPSGGQGADIAGIAAVMEVLNNPYATGAQKAVAQMKMQQVMKQNAPISAMDRLNMDYRQAQLDALTAKTGRDAGGGETEFGLNPIFAQDKDGNLIAYQLSKTGELKEVELPEGMTVTKGVQKMDLGTHYQLINTVTGEKIGEPVPKAIQAAAEQQALGTAEGKERGAAIAGLDAAIADGQLALDTIDKALAHPGRDAAVGAIQGRYIPDFVRGPEVTDYLAIHNQIKGQVFKKAFETLKGGGSITQTEGDAATAAIGRLERAQSDGAYKQALEELRGIMTRAMKDAREKAGSAQTPPAATPPAATGGEFQVLTTEQILGMSDDEYRKYLKSLAGAK